MFRYHWCNKRNFPGTPLSWTWFRNPEDHRWPHQLFLLHKIIKGSSSYLQKNLNFRIVQHYQTRSKSTKIIEQIRERTKVFENSLFPYCIKEWLKLGDKIRAVKFLKTIQENNSWLYKATRKFYICNIWYTRS